MDGYLVILALAVGMMLVTGENKLLISYTPTHSLNVVTILHLLLSQMKTSFPT